MCFTLIFPSYLFSVNSCCYSRNFAFPFLCSLSSALLAKAIALAAIVCRNFLNCCTLFIAGANPILLHLPHTLRDGNLAFPHCKVRSQILLSPCSKGFLSYLKERFLHFNKRKICVLCAAFKVQYVYYHAFILIVYYLYPISHFFPFLL